MKQIVFLVVFATLAGCIGRTVKIAPVTVEPIHVTIDVNVHDQRDAAKPAPAPPSR
jgi:hypothetical protein